MLHKCYTVSRSFIGETNGSVSRIWIVFRRGIVSKLTSAAEFLTHRQKLRSLDKTFQDTIKSSSTPNYYFSSKHYFHQFNFYFRSHHFRQQTFKLSKNSLHEFKFYFFQGSIIFINSIGLST